MHRDSRLNSIDVEALIELAQNLGLTVRREPTGTDGGGLCVLKGQRVLIIDALADLATQRDVCLSALAQLPEFDQTFVRPDIRAAVEGWRSSTRG